MGWAGLRERLLTSSVLLRRLGSSLLSEGAGDSRTEPEEGAEALLILPSPIPGSSSRLLHLFPTPQPFLSPSAPVHVRTQRYRRKKRTHPRHREVYYKNCTKEPSAGLAWACSHPDKVQWPWVCRGRRPGPRSAMLALYPAQWREFSPTEAEALGPHSSRPQGEGRKGRGQGAGRRGG